VAKGEISIWVDSKQKKKSHLKVTHQYYRFLGPVLYAHFKSEQNGLK
jgi:hypothetical protein